jgi:signal transduction histidine kinase
MTGWPRGAAEAAGPSVEEFRPTGWAFAGLGFALRLAGVLLFHAVVPNGELVRNCLLGMLIQGAALGLLACRGPVDVAIFVSGFDYIRIGMLTPLFGTGSELFLYGLLQPFIAFAFVRWSAPLRVAVVVLPLIGFATLHLAVDVPTDTGLLSGEQLRVMATVNGLAVVCLSLAIAFQAWRLTEQARRRAQDLAAARSRLVDDMSHELRTPLAILLTAAQATLESERSSEVYRRTLALVERQVRSLTRLVERMLEMGRVERGEMALEEVDDLVAAVRVVVADHEELAAARSVNLSVAAGQVGARTDGAVLGVVLGNLLANAIRYSPEGGRVEIRVDADASGHWIAVRDFGPGIPAADLPLVFQRYWRADQARSRREGHHGLGLALARRYARLLGATLEVESELGKGATFTIRW